MALTSGSGPHLAWITVDGSTFPIESGTVEQHATNKSSTFSAALPLSYPDALDAFAMLGENVTVLSVLTRGNEAPLFTGETDKVEFDFIGRVIRLTGRDKSAQLNEKKSSEKFQNKKGSDIVQDFCGRLGIPCKVEDSLLMAGKRLEQDFARISDNVSFNQVIHKLAQFDGARWFVDPQGTLHYQTKSNPTGIYTINYVPPSSGFMSCDATHLTVQRNVQAGKSISVKYKAWHPKRKKVFGYTSNVEGKAKGTQEYSYHVPNQEMDHVKQHAKAVAEEHARHEFTVHASVAGDPSISAGMGLQLTGTGFFDQLYEMDAVHHQVGMSGHRTSITARAKKEGREESGEEDS